MKCPYLTLLVLLAEFSGCDGDAERCLFRCEFGTATKTSPDTMVMLASTLIQAWLARVVMRSEVVTPAGKPRSRLKVPERFTVGHSFMGDTASAIPEQLKGR